MENSNDSCYNSIGKPSCSRLTACTVSKEKMGHKGEHIKYALYILQYVKRHQLGSISEKIKPIVLANIELRLSVSQLVTVAKLKTIFTTSPNLRPGSTHSV